MRFWVIHGLPVYKTLLLGCTLLALQTTGWAQKTLQKANQLYKNKAYGQAALFYEEALQERRNVSAMTKLANCYRITNQLEAAERILEDLVQEERAKPVTYFYYGDVLMNNGKYDAAKKWLSEYLLHEPSDEVAQLRLHACDVVKNIKPYFQQIAIRSFTYNSEADDTSPVFWNGQLLFSSDRKQGAHLLKQKTGTTDRDFLKIYQCSPDENGSYTEPEAFSSKINQLNKNTANPTFWTDTLTGVTEVYFVRNSNTASKRGEYNLQLYKATSDNGKNWKNVTPLSFCNIELNYMHPSIAPSGDTLYFVIPHGGGVGGTDLYYSTRKKDGTWSQPNNMGEQINTPTHEGFPYMHTDGKLYFCSKGHAGFGGFDVFVTQWNQANGTWSKPTNLGRPINSSFDDISISFAADGQSGAFTSARDGGDDDVFFFYLNDAAQHQNLPDLPEEVQGAIEEHH